MKKKLAKKLEIKRSTIANLNYDEMKRAEGGTVLTQVHCTLTDCPECTPDPTAGTWEPSICCETGFGVC